MQQELDELLETRASFDQLRDDVIIEDANSNVLMLKTLESILSERMEGYRLLVQSLAKSKQHIDTLRGLQKDMPESSLKSSFESLYSFIELEHQHAKQQLQFTDLKRILIEVKNDSQKRLAEYSSQIMVAEKDLTSMEKKVGKAMEKLDRSIDSRIKLDIAEKDEGIGSPLGSHKTLGGFGSSVSYFSTTAKSYSTGQSKEQIKQDRIKEADDAITKCDAQLEEDKRALRQSIMNRDQVRSASRKAFQRLDKDCKSCLESALRKIVIRERESIDEKLGAITALESKVENIRCDADINKFIALKRCEGCDMIQYSQALNVISDNKRKKYPEIDDVKEGMKRKLLAKYSEEGVALNPSSILVSQTSPSIKESGSNSPKPKEIFNSIEAGPEQSSPLISDIESNVKLLFNATYSFGVKFKHLLAQEEAAKALDPSIEALITHCSFRDHVQLASTRMTPSQKKGDEQDKSNSKEDSSSDNSIENAVCCLIRSCCDQQGRDAFCIVLNTFRSKTHTIDAGYSAMACLLWVVLEICLAENDVHTAKVIMMLSQTFFRQRVSLKESQKVQNGVNVEGKKDSDDESDDGEVGRGAVNREYVNEALIGHPVWGDKNYWEQALWECIQEQLFTVPYDKAWFEMDEANRLETVSRVHSVIFSQVMAITHSMMELGVHKQKIREFVYRMSVNHQLSEYQRQQLLMHLLQMNEGQ
jgi:hypothetical protein